MSIPVMHTSLVRSRRACTSGIEKRNFHHAAYKTILGMTSLLKNTDNIYLKCLVGVNHIFVSARNNGCLGKLFSKTASKRGIQEKTTVKCLSNRKKCSFRTISLGSVLSHFDLTRDKIFVIIFKISLTVIHFSLNLKAYS